MQDSLFLDGERLCYHSPPVKKTGTVRYAPSFDVRLADIKIIGYAPRLIVDDESGFLVVVTATGSIHYFNLGIVDAAVVSKFKDLFQFRLDNLPTISFEETNWYSFITYPQELAGQPLFKSWNWFTPRGFLKNVGKILSLDNPMWERLTDKAQAHLATSF